MLKSTLTVTLLLAACATQAHIGSKILPHATVASRRMQDIGIIKGKIISTKGQPMPGITVTVNGISTATDREGDYRFESIPVGTYTLRVSATGLKEQTLEVNVRKDREEIVNISISETGTIALEEVLVSAAQILAEKKTEMVARMPLKNLENSQVYSVVPKELLTEQVATDFRGALLSSPGVTNVMLGVGSGGTGLSMLLRGFSGADGAGSIRNGMATNYVSLSDPVNLERLEIIKGPSSTLFGTTLISYGGLVNRVTKKPFGYQKSEVSLTGGGYSLGRVAVDYNAPLNKENTFLFRLNTALHREKSFQDYGINRTFMLAPSFRYFANDKLTFDFDIEYFQSERNSTYVGFSGTPVVSNMDDLNWDFKRSYASNDITSDAKVFNLFAHAEYKIDAHWTSNSLFSFANTDNDANYLFLLIKAGTGAQLGQTVLQRRLMNLPSNFNTTQIQQNFNGEHTWGEINNKIVLGLDYTQLQTTDSRATVNDYDGSNSTVTILNEDAPVINRDNYENLLAAQTRAANRRGTKTYSAYVSDVITFFDRVNVMASLRVDHFNDVENDYEQTAWSPKFGLVYQLLKEQLSVFGNFQNGFKNVAPSTLSDDTKLVFKPEHANQLEGGVKFELLQGKINGTVSVYDIQVADKVRSVPDDEGTLVSVQDGTQNSKGVEFDLIANPFKGFHIIAGYGYNDSRFEKSTVSTSGSSVEGNKPAGVPYHSANYWASYRLTNGALKGVGFGLGGNYSGDYYFNDANTVTVSGFHTVDASLFLERPTYRFSLKGNNLGNEHYWTSTSWAIPQQTRTIMANLIIRF